MIYLHAFLLFDIPIHHNHITPYKSSKYSQSTKTNNY